MKPIHIDVKKLGRILRPGHRTYLQAHAGAQHLHPRRSPDRRRRLGVVDVAIDDHSRLAYAEVLGDEKAVTAGAFLQRAIAFFASHGISVERVMTDNGAPYRSILHAQLCHQLGLKHLRTQPYRPRTNGKAERFIQTLLREWAYGQRFQTSIHRTAALKPWLLHYNFTRTHGALGHKPPGSRLTNVARNYS